MFEKCDRTKRTTCKSDQDITNWLRRKFIIILENTTCFVNNDYKIDSKLDEGRIVRES